ncbi:hypothetical protein VPH35_009081 [Triticum aestivum]
MAVRRVVRPATRRHSQTTRSRSLTTTLTACPAALCSPPAVSVRGRYGPATLRPLAVSLAAVRRRLPVQMGGRRLELAPALLQVSSGRGRPAQTGDGAECWPRSPPRRWAWPIR